MHSLNSDYPKTRAIFLVFVNVSILSATLRNLSAPNVALSDLQGHRHLTQFWIAFGTMPCDNVITWRAVTWGYMDIKIKFNLDDL